MASMSTDGQLNEAVLGPSLAGLRWMAKTGQFTSGG